MRYSIIFLLFFLIALLSPQPCFAQNQDVRKYKNNLQQAIELLERGSGRLKPAELSLLKALSLRRFSEKTQGKRDILEPGRTKKEKKDHSAWNRDQWLAHLKANLEHISFSHFDKSLAEDWPEIRAGLEEIYRSKEFSHLHNRFRFPWQQFFQGLLERLARWLDKHSGVLGGLNIKGLDFMTYGIVITACVLLILWIRPKGFSLPGLKRSRKTQPEPARGKTEKTWRDYRGQAYHYYQNQAFRDAVRVFFISVLWEGNDKGWWVYEPEVTNREHLRRVVEPVGRREALKGLIRIYESAWYGIGQPGQKDYQECEVFLKNMEAAG